MEVTMLENNSTNTNDKKDDITYLILGKSSSGKSTIVKKLEELYGYKTIQSYTTRQPRYENEWGHTFVNEEDYTKDKNSNSICAYTFFHNNKYWVTKDMITSGEYKTYVIDMAGIRYLKRNMRYNKFKIIYIHVSFFTRLIRIIKRDGIFKAISRVINDYHEFKYVTYDYKVDNIDLNMCVQKIQQYIELEDAMNSGKILKFNDKII
jgi:guanylate kinase